MRILHVRFNGWMSLFFSFTLVLSALTFFPEQASAKARGEAVFGLCLQCHGAEGQGDKLFGAPRIAGLPKWYILAQLEKFKSGARGKHPDDDAGNRMRPMARTLADTDFDIIATYVSEMKSPSKPEGLTLIGGNAEKGKATFAVCAACHGPNADGNEAVHAPSLKISNDWYLVHQLANFKNKIRAGDPAKDPIGATMAPNASSLDEQAMKDVITYIQSLK